jgi:regulator of replication initiation timing
MKDSQAIVTPLGVSGSTIKLDSPEWLRWLSERSSFSYQSAISDYTCNKRSNGKWYASKRKGDRSQGSKSLAQEYLGAGDKVTKTKLEEIARKFALPDRDYWYLKHPKPKTGEPTSSPGVGCTTDQGTTKVESSSQAADEIAKLKAEFEQNLTDLQAQLRECQHRCIHLENENNRLERLGQDYSQETVARLSTKYTKALKDIEHWKQTAESYKRQAAKLKAEQEELHTELGNSISARTVPAIDLGEFYDAVVLKYPPRERKVISKPLTRFKALIAEALTRRGVTLRD